MLFEDRHGARRRRVGGVEPRHRRRIGLAGGPGPRPWRPAGRRSSAANYPGRQEDSASPSATAGCRGIRMPGRAHAPSRARQRCAGCRRPPRTDRAPGCGRARTRPPSTTVGRCRCCRTSRRPDTPLAWLVRYPGCRPNALLKPSRKARGVNRGGPIQLFAVSNAATSAARKAPTAAAPRSTSRRPGRAVPQRPGLRTVRSWIGSPDSRRPRRFTVSHDHCWASVQLRHTGSGFWARTPENRPTHRSGMTPCRGVMTMTSNRRSVFAALDRFRDDRRAQRAGQCDRPGDPGDLPVEWQRPVADYISYRGRVYRAKRSRPTCRCHGRRSSPSSATECS